MSDTQPPLPPMDPTVAISVLRDMGYKVIGPDPDAEFHVQRDARATSRAIEPKMRKGSLQTKMLVHFEAVGDHGATDDEIEELSRLSHQSISACRNTLMRKGLVRDSGIKRKTRYGNDAVVWVRTKVVPT